MREKPKLSIKNKMKIAITTDTHTNFSRYTKIVHEEKFLPELKKYKPDLVIHSGDWGITNPGDVYDAFESFRKFLDCPIIGVLGNHDLWDGKRYQFYQDIKIKLLKYAQKFDIKILEGEYYDFNELTIFGYMGWYGRPPPSNDKNWMGTWIEADEDLRLQSNVQVKLLNKQVDIVVTHFPPYINDIGWEAFCGNTQHYDLIKKYSQFLVCGHNHQAKDDSFTLNAGSDYDQPAFIKWDFWKDQRRRVGFK